MVSSRANHYEKAFADWLIDSRVPYIAVDEKKRSAFGNADIKSFDYILYPDHQHPVIAEIKGRKYKGSNLTKLTGLQTWVTRADLEGLARWQQLMGTSYRAAFIFAYHVESPDVDLDGRAFYEYRDRRYLFFAVALDEYLRYMKLRSPSWQTVCLSAENFRRCAVQVQQLLR